mgnify:CR=1 FL=1
MTIQKPAERWNLTGWDGSRQLKTFEVHDEGHASKCPSSCPSLDKIFFMLIKVLFQSTLGIMNKWHTKIVGSTV